MKKQHYLSNEELASFCSQMGILIHAGIAPIEGLRILLSDTSDPGSKKLLEDVLNAVSEGNTFSESLKVVGVFPDYVVNTLKLGEEAGAIDEVMASLAEYYERESQISESIKNAVTYPLVMILMMLIVIVILITKVLPIFNQVYMQLGSEMTGFAASLMNLGASLNSYSFVFIALLVIIVVMYLFFAKTDKGKETLTKITSSLFFTRRFYEGIAAGRFAGGIALSLAAGLDTFSSLDMVKELVENKTVCDKIDIVKKSIAEGNNFAEGLKEGQIFSNVNNRMIAVGVKTGEIEMIMKRIADDCQKKSEKKINEIISVIEPTLVIVLSLIVGLILLSVILPLMGIMATIG